MRTRWLMVAAIIFVIAAQCISVGAFPLDGEWKKKDARDFQIYDHKGKEVSVGMATLMEHGKTKERVALFSPYENDEVVLSMLPDELEKGFESGAEPFRFEPDGSKGVHPDFVFVDENSFQIVLYNKAWEEIGRRTFTRAFHRFVPADEPMSDLECVPGRKVTSPYGQWQEFTICSPRILWMSWLYTSGSQEPLVKLWIERTSMPEPAAAMWCAVRLQNGQWAQMKILRADQFVWEPLGRPIHKKNGLVNFELMAIDSEGNKLIRRIFH